MVNNQLLECSGKVQQACYTRSESSQQNFQKLKLVFDSLIFSSLISMSFVFNINWCWSTTSGCLLPKQCEFKPCYVAYVTIRFLFASTGNGEKGCIRLDKCSSPEWTCCYTNGCNAWANNRIGISDVIKPCDMQRTWGRFPRILCINMNIYSCLDWTGLFLWTLINSNIFSSKNLILKSFIQINSTQSIVVGLQVLFCFFFKWPDPLYYSCVTSCLTEAAWHNFLQT